MKGVNKMSKKMVRLLSLIVAVFMLLAVGLVGCGTKNEEAAKNTTTQTTAANVESKKEEPKKEPVTIAYSTFRAEDEAIYKTLIDKFQKENPEITVNFQTNKDTNAYYQGLKADIQSGAAPDVFDMHIGNDFLSYGKEGIISDLSGLDFIKNYSDGAKELTTIDGKIYGYTQAVNMILGIYNKEIFNKYGITEVPKDWNEFVAIVKKLKDGGEGGIAYCGADVKAFWLNNLLMVEDMGAQGFKKFFEDMDKGDIVSIKDNIQAYDVLKTLSEFNKNKLLYDNSESVKYTQALSLFAQKKAPIVIMGTWTFGTKETDYPGIDQGIFAIPTFNKANVAYAEAAQTACVFSKSKNINEAMKFVNFLATPENSALYITQSKMTPTVKGVKADFSGADMLSSQIEKGITVLPVVDQPKKELYDGIWNKLIENILFKGNDVDKEIADFDAAYKKLDIKNKK